MIALPARDDEYEYAFFGRETDAIILMNYDQHWLTSEPGPIAAQDWFVENLRQILKVVPAQKIVVGIANYAYDWTETAKHEPRHAEEFSIQEALLHVEESEANVEFDSASLNPHYSYYDEHNHVHQVWMLDAVTAYNELRASERMGVQGLGARLREESPLFGGPRKRSEPGRLPMSRSRGLDHEYSHAGDPLAALQIDDDLPAPELVRYGGALTGATFAVPPTVRCWRPRRESRAGSRRARRRPGAASRRRSPRLAAMFHRSASQTGGGRDRPHAGPRRRSTSRDGRTPGPRSRPA